MSNYYCKYCGTKYATIQTLTTNTCQRHPLGPLKGKHALYECREKTNYQCKFCGKSFASLAGLTANTCLRHPNGPSKGRHEPAL